MRVGCFLLMLILLGCSASWPESYAQTTATMTVNFGYGNALCNGYNKGYIDGGNIHALGSLSFMFYNSAGTRVNVGGKNAISLTASQLPESVTVTGIPYIPNARVVFAGFEQDMNTVKWRGEVAGIDFEKGKETSITVVLYPASDTTTIGCFPKKIQTPRFGHVATTLSDGRILITGGFTTTSNGVWQANDSVELLDIESGTVDYLADMKESRAFHMVTSLPDGRFLIAGGVREMEIKKMSVADYPDLPVTLQTQSVGVEVYKVGLAKVNNREAEETDASTAEFISSTLDTANQFVPYQSYAYAVSDETTGSGTLFMVGGVKDGVAQSKIFGIEVTVVPNGAISAVVNEYHSDKTETFVMPLVAQAKTDVNGAPRVLVVGGHKATATKFAHLISKNIYDPWISDAPNLFFGAVAEEEGIVVVSNGLELPENATAFQMNPRGRIFDISAKSSKDATLFGLSTWFHDMMLDVSGGYFAVIGGAVDFDPMQTKIEATNFVQYIDLDTMNFTTHEDYDYFNGDADNDGYGSAPGRVLHRVARTGDMLFITGGLDDDLKGLTIVDTIPILSTTRPW